MNWYFSLSSSEVRMTMVHNPRCNLVLKKVLRDAGRKAETCYRKSDQHDTTLYNRGKDEKPGVHRNGLDDGEAD